MKRADWSRPLPRSLVIPTVMTLTTLADVQKLIDHNLPAETRNKTTWRYVRQQLDEAAYGADAVNVSIALRMALMLENVECRPK